MRLPSPERGDVPAWELPHLRAEEAALLLDLDARLTFVYGYAAEGEAWGGESAHFRVRWGSTVSVRLADGYPPCTRAVLTDPRDGRRLRVLRHSSGGCRILLSRAECAALRRAAEPYLEGGRARTAERWAAQRRSWARFLEEDAAREAAERAVRQAEMRARLDAMTEGERREWHRRRNAELDRILGRSGG